MKNDARIVLDAVEQAELRSLTWGYVEGSLTLAEVVRMARASSALSSGLSDADCEDLVEDLIDAQLLFERQGRLRSRFAETVRLLVRSKQIFQANQWRGAPRLVADFRIDRRSRVFPRRDISPETVWSQFPPETQADALKRAAWSALTSDAVGGGIPLAGFQGRSAVRLLTESESDAATIVTAGTGSGKTYCFYLPALTEIAAQVARGAQHTQALALYPRVELLKDQLREAVGLTERLGAVLRERSARAIRIGVYYGDTPHSWAHLKSERRPKTWQSVAGGYACPYLRCTKCGSSLAWLESDAVAGEERLRCTAGRCDGVVSNVVLTRDRLKQLGCDLLFITTESLNARMTEKGLRHVLGIDRTSETKPTFVLLDEVHTYAGRPGAQVALTLRRWRHAVGMTRRGVRWIGLSATLRDADEFFATLTGVPSSGVIALSPDLREECFEKACEYQLILRGDPSGQTSLLSTTIQAAMLVGRMAEGSAGKTSGTIGRKTFIFTDDLDVNNRLYHSLADAEGYWVNRNRLIPDGSKRPLAGLRGEGADGAERDIDGQRWWAAEEISPDCLTTRLPLGRTTSQDSGVDANALVVVATASLEVGFNDTSVGFVIQHKAPRGSAGFLQRKGRAGRSQSMQPWMITVLSDYGRDRVAYAAYEQLFDPALPPTNLPISNLFVLRVQATYALLEWLYLLWEDKPNSAYLWSVAAGPKAPVAQRRAIVGLLEQLVHGKNTAIRDSLNLHLKRALCIGDKQLDLILWQPPRGLMLEVVPTLLRRMASDWLLAFPTQDQLHEPFERRPLPEFLPAQLFGELQLPEIEVLPDHGLAEEMAVGSALNMLVPGRVSRRFAPFDSNLSHWIPVDLTDQADAACVALDNYVLTSNRIEVEGSDLLVLRPKQYRMDAAPPEVLPTSNGRWDWNSLFLATESPMPIDPPQGGTWAAMVESLDAHLYSRRSPVRVQRYTANGRANVRVKRGSTTMEHEISYGLSYVGKAAALGLEQDVDGLRLVLRLPTPSALAAHEGLPVEVIASCKSLLFRHLVTTDRRLKGLANSFQLDWLAQVFLAASVSAAELNQLDFTGACNGVSIENLQEAIGILFPSVNIDPGQEQELHEDIEDGELDARITELPSAEQKLVRALRGFVHSDAVVCILRELGASASQPSTEAWGVWLREILCETISTAFAEATALVLPHNSASDQLLADWSLDETDGRLTLWLTEQSLGGTGVIEELASLCESEPRKLWRGTEASVAPSDGERSAEAFEAFCYLTKEDVDFRKIAVQCVEERSHIQRAHLLEDIAGRMRLAGQAVGRTFAVGANARLLRPGMGPTTWSLLWRLHDHRSALQARLGVIVDLRAFCRIAIVHPTLGSEVRGEMLRLRGGRTPSDGEAAQILSGMLWPQAAELRCGRRPTWHPFRDLGDVEPGLLRSLLDFGAMTTIDVANEGWQEILIESLSKNGVARISVEEAKRTKLSDALAWIATMPIDLGWVQVYGAIERIELSGGRVFVQLALREVS